MLKKIMPAVLTTFVVLAIVTVLPVEAVRIPASAEEVQDLTDAELLELLEYFNNAHGPAVQDFWVSMGSSFGAWNPTSFRAKFPRFTAFLDDVLEMSPTGSSAFLVARQSTEDVCEDGGGLGDILAKAFIEIPAAILSFMDVQHGEFEAQYTQIANQHLRGDLTALCPTCEEGDIEAMLYLFIEESIDAALIWGLPDAETNANMQHRVYLWVECMRERCRRGLARGTLCKKLPWHPTCGPGATGRERRCGDWWDPGRDPARPVAPDAGGDHGGGGGGGTSDAGGGRLNNTTGKFVSVPPIPCFNTIAGCGWVDVPDDLIPLPPYPGGGGGTIPPPGSFDPNADDPSRECWGPCCGPKGGGGARSGNGTTCWRDGVLVPCVNLF